MHQFTQTHIYIHTRKQSDLKGNSTQFLVSWVNLFGRGWIWQSSSSTANNVDTNEFISSTPLFSPFPAPLLTFALLFSHCLSLVLSFVSICLFHTHPFLFIPSLLASLFLSPLLYSPSRTSSLYLHRWFQWLLWVLIIPSITVGKCAIKVDSYSAPHGSIFIRVTPDFRGSGGFFRHSMPSSFCHL